MPGNSASLPPRLVTSSWSSSCSLFVAVREMLIFILLLLSFDFVLPEENPLQNPQSGPHSRRPEPVGKFQQSSKPVNLSSYYPFNVTISHLSPRSIEISWNCKDNTLNDRYEVTIKPVHASVRFSVSYRVVEMVPNNICYLLMEKLEPDTAYQVAVSAFAGGSRKRSRYVFFRTYMEDDAYNTEFTEDDGGGQQEIYDGNFNDVFSAADNAKNRLRLPRVRLVEISLVGMALVLWAGAIVLFFHRWGKIRMLLPYQPDYKEMKNNSSACTTCSMTPHHQCQKIHHLQNPAATTLEYYPAQPTMTTTYHHHPLTPHHHLPHQPMSEPGPGPSSSTFNAGRSNVNVVTVTEAGCSPIRYKTPSFNEGDISIDMTLVEHHRRKSKSAEELKQSTGPWEAEAEAEQEPNNDSNELDCTTEF